MFHHYCLHQNHLAEWLNTKKIWVRKNIKLCMKNEIMASERRALQICWPGNHFKVNCGKCGLAPLLGKDVFSIYSTYPFFIVYTPSFRLKGQREVTSWNKHVSSGREMSPSARFQTRPPPYPGQLQTRAHMWKNRNTKIKAAVKPWGYGQAE